MGSVISCHCLSYAFSIRIHPTYMLFLQFDSYLLCCFCYLGGCIFCHKTSCIITVLDFLYCSLKRVSFEIREVIGVLLMKMVFSLYKIWHF